MNVLFFLTPKCECSVILETDSLRQVMEKMEKNSHAAVPLLDREGRYSGTISEGDLLWFIKNRLSGGIDMKAAERIKVTEIPRKRDYTAISGRANVDEIIQMSISQNFVPIQDDEEKFIGIVTRTDVMKYISSKLKAGQKPSLTDLQ